MIDRTQLLELCDFCDDEIHGIDICGILYCAPTWETCVFYIILELFDDFKIPDTEPSHYEDICYGQGSTLRPRAGGRKWDALYFYDFVAQNRSGMTIQADNRALPRIDKRIIEETDFPEGIPRIFLTKKDLLQLISQSNEETERALPS